MGKKKKKNAQMQPKVQTQNLVEKMQQSVVGRFQSELRESEAFAQEITAAVGAHLNRIRDPNCPKFEVGRLTLTLNKGKTQLMLTAAVEVQFGKKTIQHKAAECIDVNWKGGLGEEDLTQLIRQNLPLLEQKLVERMTATLPHRANEFYGRYTNGAHPELEAMAAEIAEQPDVLAMLEQRRTSLQASYRQLQEKRPCPTGFRPANIVSLRLNCAILPNKGRCALEVHMDSGIYFEKQKEYPLGNCAFYEKEERQREYLQSHIMACLKTLMQRAEQIPPLYFTPSLRDIPGITDPLEALLRQGTTSLDHITLKWRGPSYVDGPLLYVPDGEDGSVYCGREESAFEQCPLLSLRLGVLNQPVLPLEQHTGSPQEVVSFSRLGEALEAALVQAFAGKEVPTPQMVLQLNKKSQPYLTCGARSIALEKNETAAGQKLMKFLTRTVEIETERPLERQRQLDLLNSLNPTELAVLRHITANGETWYTALAGAIEDKVCTTKVYTGTCLEHLTERTVQVDGKVQPLLEVRWVFSRKHDDFRMYRAGAQLDREMLASATGRPFSVEETAAMKSAERGKWFTRYLLEAEGEQRWTRFNEVLDHMPRTFLTVFVKSEEGQTFLKGFTGPEAMFARLTVEELPGCKRLAAKLWPEEAEDEIGEE